MKRFGQFTMAVLIAGLVAGAAAQERKLIPPIRGEAALDITKPNTKIQGNQVVTVIIARNPATSGAIAGLKVEEQWYDKKRNPVTGDTYRHPRPLRAGEVVTITLRSPRNPNMDTNQYQFSHANGSIKTNIVAKIDVPKTEDGPK
ncbi:MAG: hypothetical protein AB7O28_22030 [Vicinamibacterales bacterium]